MRGLDSYLEAPYVRQAATEAAFEKWCEANDREPSDDAWDDFYTDMAEGPDPDDLRDRQLERDYDREHD